MRFFPLLLLLLVACQAPKSPPLPTVIAMQDGRINLADGNSLPIPHYGEPDYTIFYIVRHCEKIKDGSADPDLSPEGKARAERLGKVMDHARLDRVCSTNAQCTRATGAVVQYWSGGPPTEIFPADAQSDWLSETLSSSAGKNLFYVGHAVTIPPLLNQLVGREQFGDFPDDEFGRFYVVSSKGLGQSEVLELQF